MKRRVLLFAFVLLTAFSLSISAAQQRRPSRETWYERALRQINPNDTDYGAIWEERKRALMDRIGSPYFQYGLAMTATTVWLFVVVFAQHVSHRRKEEFAVESIADVLRHDAYAREKAEEAIKRHNDHIETCNRMVEAEESGASKWVSAAEWEMLQSEGVGLREETRRLREECEKHKATVIDLSMHSRSNDQAPAPRANDTRIAELEARIAELEARIAELETRINELQNELVAERKKNQRIKAKSVQ